MGPSAKRCGANVAANFEVDGMKLLSGNSRTSRLSFATYLPLLLVCWLTIGVSSAEAICVTVKTSEMRLRHWDVVFLGKASLDRPPSSGLPETTLMPAREMRFSVLASWKGVASGQEEVSVQVEIGDEGPNYQVGGVYVIYARSFVTEDGEELLLGPVCVDAFQWCERFERPQSRALHRLLGRPDWWVGPDPEDRC